LDQPHDLKHHKAALRAVAKTRRASAAAAAREAGVLLARRLLEHAPAELLPPPGAPVSAYWPMGDELDTRPLIAALHARGHTIGLPVILGKRQPLLFRAWAHDLDFEPGGFGTQVPPAGQPEVLPALLYVPLLAFDRAGYRLGYGGGFYDRTLAKLAAAAGPGRRPIAVGVAFAGQEVERVPREATDERLDWIVTEAETIRIDQGL
jgi:5-formyltetrahydrofolate cyclo-ligase